MKLAPQHFKSPRGGFTLVELLTVVSIMSLMLVLARPAITALAGSGGFNNSVSQVAQTLDLARQRAIAKNTYVWVAIHSGMGNGEPLLGLCVVESQTGTDILDWNGTSDVLSNADLALAQKVVRLPQVELLAAGAVTTSQIPSLPSLGEPASDLVRAPVFRYAAGLWSGKDFDYVVQFAPGGEARVSPGLVGTIELGLSKWPAGEKAVIRLNGITGLSTVYH